MNIYVLGTAENPVGAEEVKSFTTQLKAYREAGTEIVTNFPVCIVSDNEASFLMMLHDKQIIDGEQLKKAMLGQVVLKE